MENLKDLLTPKTFNRISYVAVICWIVYGVTLLAIFAQMENSDSFRCEAKLEKMDLVRGKCSDQYKKQHNKSGIPVYGFVIADFSLIGIVCVIYSQVVKTRVDQVEANRRRADAESHNNRRKGRRLFLAYFCQLTIRLSIGIAFIVLQTQVLYPDNFPSDFRCQIAGASHAGNTSSTGNIQNSTMYQCHSQQATKKTSWLNGVVVGNGILTLIILVEIICILALRVKKGKEFFEDSQFVDYLTPQEPSQEPSQLKPIKFIENQKERIKKYTEKPPDLNAIFQVQHGEGKRNVDRKIDDIYTNLVLIPNRAEYDFTGNREEQLKVYPASKKNLEPISREDIVDAENKKILIVGRPGIGKTLFLNKLLRDWALGNVFNHFEFAFSLKFRKFNSVSGELSLRDLLSRSEYSQTLSDEVWNRVLKNPEKVLICFDGLDEYQHRSSVAWSDFETGENPVHLSALFYDIVEENVLPGASMVTTTRPTAVSDVTHLHFHKTMEILGFTSEQVQEYVGNFAKNAPADAGMKIWEHIKTNMNIFSLCYIPVNCYIICSCLLQVLEFHSEKGKGLSGVGLPTKLTDIYQKALQLFFFRHNEQYRGKRQEDTKHLPPEAEEKLKPLAKLAFDGLTQSRLIFGQKEVPEDLVNSALFHQLPDDQPDAFTREAQYCFIHLTMQEFLAAKHITDTMKGEELRRFVAVHIDKGVWQLVLQFVGGLLGEQSTDIFTDLLPKTTEENDKYWLMDDDSDEPRTVTCWPTYSEKHLAVTLMKCINESNESGSVVQSKLEEIDAVEFSHCRLAPADCTAVVRFLQSCTQISHINLFNNNIGSLGCVEIVKLFDNANCQLRILDLSYNNIGDKGVQELAKGLVNNNELRSLNLSWNNIGDKGVQELAKGLVNNNELHWLYLWGNYEITDEAKIQIQQAYPNCKIHFKNVWE